MKYKGIELVPITKVQSFEEPRKMLVWSKFCGIPQTRYVKKITLFQKKILVVCDDIDRGEEYFGNCAEIPQPKMRDMTSLEVMEYLHIFQQWLNGNKKKLLQCRFPTDDRLYECEFNNNLSDGNFDGGVVVYNPDEDMTMWSRYTQLDTYDNIQDCKFGVLKNGKVTEFELPHIEVNNKK